MLDFDAFDWWEEDEPIVGHPRDPFHRIDVRQSSRRVRLEHEGVVLADSDRGRWLFEGTFPMVRYYLPPSDVRVELRPSDLHTTCAYKGHATHYTAVARRPGAGEHRLELRGSAARRGRGRRAGLLLPGAAGPAGRRRTRRAGAHPLVVSLTTRGA